MRISLLNDKNRNIDLKLLLLHNLILILCKYLLNYYLD